VGGILGVGSWDVRDGTPLERIDLRGVGQGMIGQLREVAQHGVELQHMVERLRRARR
jgi:hypothetical protein